MNKSIIMGRLTRDPELKAVGSGTEVCNFTVASDEYVKKGEKHTDFFRCEAWGQTGVFINQYFHKGDGILVAGSFRSNEKDDKTYWQVRVEGAFFPPSSKSAGAAEPAATMTPYESNDDLPFG